MMIHCENLKARTVYPVYATPGKVVLGGQAGAG